MAAGCVVVASTRCPEAPGDGAEGIADVVTGPAREDDDPDAAWRELHEEREALERALSLCQTRQRVARDAAEASEAAREEADLLLSLDRVLTRIRAAEYGRQPGARRW